jgi:hypothetical protein
MAKMKAMVCGVGINDMDYKVTLYEGEKTIWTCPYYSTWRGMLERCYSDRRLKARPSYEGAKVHKPWLRFSNFRSWMMQQQWIEFTDDEECNIEKKQLDKDLLSGGKRGKLYSPETCVFVSRCSNMFLIDGKKARGLLPLGLSKDGNKYRSQVNNPFTRRRDHLGMSTSPEIAQAFYISRKKELARELAENESDKRVKKALLSIDWSH